MIPRKTYFKLTNLDPDSLTALRRRDQIPCPSTDRNEYSLFDAFTVMLAENFSQSPDGLSMSRGLSTNIVRNSARLLIERQEDIEEGAHPDSTNSVFVGVIYRQETGAEPFCGTATDLVDAMSFGPRVIRLAYVNASLALAAFKARCLHNDVDTSTLWPPAESVSSFDELRNARRQILRDAVATTNAKRKSF